MEQQPENVIARLPSSSTINDEDYATAEEEPPVGTSRLEEDDQGVLSDACSTDSDHELELVGLDREHELKSKLEKSRTMLRAYVQHTTSQDRLLGHLGAQVEEYRNRCSRLEEVLRQCPCASRTENIQDDRAYEEDPPDLPSALSALELERARCAELKQLNVVLREHLEITTETNATLTMHMERMTEDWQNATRADAANRGSSSSATQDEFRADSEQSSVPRLRRDLQELKGDLGDMRQAFATSLASIQTMLHDAGEAAGRVQLSLADDAAGSDQPDLGLTRSRDEGVLGVFAAPPDSVAKMVTDDLNHQVEALHRENEGLHAVLASKLETIEQMTNVIDALKAAQCNLGASVEKSSQENVDLRMREVILQSEVRSHEAKLKNLALELESVRREKKECMGVIASLRKHIANLEDQQQASERELSLLRKALRDIEELNDSLERDLQEMCNTSRQLEQSNSELAKAKSDMELEHEELAAERDSLARREADVTREMARLESLLEESVSRQTKLEATLSASDKEIANGKAAFLQLSSQKDVLLQEASSLRQSVASQRETNAQLSAQKEALAKDKSQLEVELRHCRAEGDKLQSELIGWKEAREAAEVDLRIATEALAKIQREKETADTKLRDSAAELEKLHEKLKRLERERKADADEWGTLQASLTEKLHAVEKEASQRLAEERRLLKEEMDKHRQERAGRLRQLEESHQAELKRQEELLRETETKWRSEVALYQQRLEDVRVELQEKLASSEQLRAEMQSMAEDERRELLNTLGRCKEEVSVLRRNLVAFRDEASSKMATEQAKVASALKDVDTLRVELEQTRTAFRLKEAQEKSRESQFHKELNQATKEREQAVQRLNETDASRTALQRELSEALGKKSEGERRVEVLNHQLSEVRQSYTLVTAETEQLRRAIGDLQQELRSATQERDASLQEASEKFRGAEKARASLAEELRELRSTHGSVERARQVLERKVRALESALLEHGSELDSLRKLSEQRRHQVKSARQDVLSWKRKVAALEDERDVWQRERASLGHRLDESERRAQAERNAREGAVREAGRVAERLAQDRSDLEKQLLASGQETHEARLALCAAQGCTAALESELKVVSESRKSIEGTLDSLLSVLRCSLGIQTKYELRSSSPQRPAAGRRHGGDPSNESFRGDGSSFRSEDSLGRSLLRRPTPDVEAELVLQAVDALSRRIAALEADKEKVEAECERSQRVIAGLEDELAATKSTLARLTKANDTLVADNTELRSQVSSQLEVVTELKHASQTLEWEKASLVDQLEDSARRYQLKTDQCDKLQAALSRSRDHPPSPIRPSEPLESRLSKLELERQLSQAKVERLKLRVTESQAEVRRLQEAKEEATSELTRLERRAESLDHDNSRLRAEIAEHASKVKILNAHLVEEIAKGRGLEEEKRSLESQLRVARVQLESVRFDQKRDKSVIDELKGQKGTLETRLSALAVQLAECESAKQRLDKTPVRTLHREETRTWQQMVETLREEKRQLQGEVTRLRRQLTGTVDSILPPVTPDGSRASRRPRRSLAERDVPDGASLHSPEVSRLKTQKSLLEAKVRTLEERLSQQDQVHSEELTREHRELVAEIARLREELATHERRRTSTPVHDEPPEFATNLSHRQDIQGLLDRSLHTVSEDPERLRDQAMLLSAFIDGALEPGDSLRTPSKLAPYKGTT
ncbi:unnamed protein product [Ixodes persulcatus]